MAASLSEQEIARELGDYGVELPPSALAQLSCYLDLLLHWNRRLNLTGLRDPKAIVRQLFAESLYLTRVVALRGWLLDVGSGAGFPGLALKLALPELQVTLIESRQKKCAFLKQVGRECQLAPIDVVCERFEAWAKTRAGCRQPGVITTRAVAMRREILGWMQSVLAPAGKGIFLTSDHLAVRIKEAASDWNWEEGRSIPNSASIILVGSPKY